MKIEDASILVTGGAGLIGSATIDLLLREHGPRRIVVLDNLSRGSLANLKNALLDRRVTLMRGDIRNADAVHRAVQGMDAVIHLAALRITACAAAPREAMEVMCDGSFNVVDAARAAGVSRVVAASSASVYGLAEHFPTDERHHPWGNRTWYGATKLMLEGLLRAYHDMYGLRYVALRYFNVYGPRMDVQGKYTEVLVRWMERIATGQPPLVLGDGQQTLDFVYIDDVAQANVAALAAEAEDEVFNIASGCETSLNELAAALLAAMDSPLQPEHGPEREINPVSRRLADISRARERLGFEPKVGLDEGLRRLVRWWQSQRRELECA